MWLKFVRQVTREKGHAEGERVRSRELQRVPLSFCLSSGLHMHEVKLYKGRKESMESSRLKNPGVHTEREIVHIPTI